MAALITKLVNSNDFLVRTIFSIASIIFCNCSIAAETDHEALKYFTQGKKAVNSGQLEEAISWFKKALTLRPDDGVVILEEKITNRSMPLGRTLKPVTVDESIKKEYRPNAQLKHAKALLEEKTRLANPPKLQLEWITFREPTRDNVLDGGESGVFELRLDNHGPSKAKGVTLNISGSDTNGLLFNPQLSVGDVDAQSTSIIELPVKAERSVIKQNRALTITAKEITGYDSNTIQIQFTTHPHLPEKLVITDTSFRDFNNDGLIEPTESVTVTHSVKNIGKGVSNKLSAKIILGENVFLGPQDNANIDIGEIYPGQEKNISFSIITNRRFNHNQAIPVTVQILDEKDIAILKATPDLAVFRPDEDIKSVSLNSKPRSNINLPETSVKIVDFKMPARTFRDPNAIAVVIGNRRYQTPGMPEVKYAHNDARAIKQYLVETAGFLENNVLYFEDATSATFNETFGSKENHVGKLYNYIKPHQSSVFIYYSGHGAPDLKNKSAYFVPVDANPNYIANSGYALTTFYKNLSKLPAKHITVALDTCFSGNSDGGILFGSISPIIIGTRDSVPTLKNASIFLSSSTDQVSTWFHQKKHGLFTYFFLKGISGHADTNQDKRIFNNELFHYIKEKVSYNARRMNGNEQQPFLAQQRDKVFINYNN